MSHITRQEIEQYYERCRIECEEQAERRAIGERYYRLHHAGWRRRQSRHGFRPEDIDPRWPARSVVQTRWDLRRERMALRSQCHEPASKPKKAGRL